LELSAQGEEEPDSSMPMEVDEAPQVSFHAYFISGQFLMFE
jgi:hypothetical protein